MTPLELQAGEYEANRGQLARRTPCRGCDQPMAWIETRDGKRMPLSLTKVRELACPDCHGPGNQPYRCPRCLSTGVVYAVLNHWADCPDRERFRRKATDPEPAAPKGEA